MPRFHRGIRKEEPPIWRGRKDKHRCRGGGTFETALPRAGPDLELSTPLLRSAPIFDPIVAIRRKAGDHCAAGSRMSSAVARKTLALGFPAFCVGSQVLHVVGAVGCLGVIGPDGTVYRTANARMRRCGSPSRPPTMASSPPELRCAHRPPDCDPRRRLQCGGETSPIPMTCPSAR